MAEPQTIKSAAIAKIEEKPKEFIPYGAQDPIRLTVEIIKNVIAKPTKSGKTCSYRDAVNFLMMCAGKRLNPFESDCYLVGYDNQKTGLAEFSQITAETAFLKRAELHPEFDGIESGLILLNEDGSVEEVQGEFYLPGQECLGGWARVHMKTRKIPTYDRLLMHKYKKQTPFWDTNPEHQIAKCARVAVLRRSFPTMLGGLYLAEEMALPMTMVLPHEINPARLVDVKSADADPSGGAQAGDTTVAGTDAAAQDQSKLANKQDNDVLGELIIAEGFTFDHFRKWCQETGNVWDGFDSCASFAEIPVKTATRLLRAKTGLLNGLKLIKETKNV